MAITICICVTALLVSTTWALTLSKKWQDDGALSRLHIEMHSKPTNDMSTIAREYMAMSLAAMKKAQRDQHDGEGWKDDSPSENT